MRKKTVKYWLVFVLALVIIAGISSCMPSSTAGNLNIEVNISNGASITVDKVPYTYELKVKVSYDRAKTVLLIVYVNNEQSGSLKIPVGEDYTVPVVFKNFGIVNLKITVQGVGDDRKDITKSVFINRKPEVSLSSPDNSQSFEGGYISFTWVATDTKDDALTSYIDIGDGNWIKVSEEKKITSNDGIFTTYIYSYKAERIHGDYTWKVKVVDSHKVEIVSGTRTYKVKNRSPSVKITSPANGEEVLHGKVALEVEVNDPDGDYPVTVELYHSNDNRNYVKVSEKTTSDGGNLSFDINVDSNKNYFWYAKATDSYNKNRMSNTSSIVSISVKENQPPQFVEVDIDGKDITNFLNDGTEMTVGRGERVIRIKAIDPEGDYPLKVVIYEKEGEEWIKEASGNLEDPDDEYRYEKEFIAGKKYSYKIELSDSYNMEPAVLDTGELVMNVPENLAPEVRIESISGEEIGEDRDLTGIDRGWKDIKIWVMDEDNDYPVVLKLYKETGVGSTLIGSATLNTYGEMKMKDEFIAGEEFNLVAEAFDSYASDVGVSEDVVHIEVKENNTPQIDVEGLGSVVQHGEKSWDVSVTDPEGDYPIEVGIYEEKEGEGKRLIKALDVMEGESINVDSYFEADSTYTFTIVATDSYASSVAFEVKSITVYSSPNLAPEVRILEPDSDNILSSGSYTLKLRVNDPEGDYPVTLEVFQSTDNTNFTQIYSGEVSGGEIDITTSVRAGYDYYWTVVATDSYSCGEKSATSSVHVSVSPELDLGESTMVDVDGIYKIYAHYSGLKGFEIKVRGQNVEADDIEVAEFDNVGCDILSNTIGDMVIKSVMLDEAIGVYGKLAQIDSNGEDIDVSYSTLRLEDMGIDKVSNPLIAPEIIWSGCDNCSKYDVYISGDMNLVENLNKEALIKADTADSSIIFYVPSAGTYYIRVVGKSDDGNDQVVSNVKSIYFDEPGESFENGEMPSYFDYTERWQVVSDQAHSGSYSIKTWSNWYEYVDSSMEVEVNIPYDAIVEFWVRVYNNYHGGRFQFYVDGEKKYDYDMYNERTDWSVVRVPVSSGSHVLKWFVDDRDWYGNFSLWIDDIVIKPAKVEWNEHTYYMPPYAKYWHDAKASAENHGGHLVIIESAEEQEFIENYYLGGYNIWIGLTDEEQEGVWKWVDGRLLSDTGYSHWNSGEPNNSGDEDYAHMCESSGYWNDYKNYGNFYFIIEYDDGN